MVEESYRMLPWPRHIKCSCKSVHDLFLSNPANKQTNRTNHRVSLAGGGNIAPYKDLFTFPSQTQIPPCHSEQWQQKQFLFFHITVTIEVCASFPHCHNHDHTASVVPLSKAGSPQHIHQEPQLCSRPEKLLRTKADIY